ncbi:MAG: cyclic nucleotide-binding domain-containing protein [Actinomycetota bacterium]|jgi:CRP-like cAMP-binding protein|nr:cyclic nucleotide-binding domain-containing protein [Actinomycetota bacterium]
MTIAISITDAPVFAGIKKKERESLERLATALSFEPGATIVEQGRHGQEFAVITSGVVAVEADGERVASLGPGDFFGEMALIGLGGGQHDTKRTASVRAETAVTAEVMSVQEFSSALHSLPEAAAAIGRVAAERVAANS